MSPPRPCCICCASAPSRGERYVFAPENSPGRKGAVAASAASGLLASFGEVETVGGVIVQAVKSARTRDAIVLVLLPLLRSLPFSRTRTKGEDENEGRVTSWHWRHVPVLTFMIAVGPSPVAVR